VTTPKGGTPLGLRVSVTLGDTTFSAPITVGYKAKQGKSGSAKREALSKRRAQASSAGSCRAPRDPSPLAL
jgi:hypothetical protein